MASTPTGDQAVLEPNAAQCLDCDELYDLTDGEVVCPEDETHPVEPIHVTSEPLGFDDDRDYFHHGHKQYEYPAREDLP